jgi:hypothetical protein
MNINIVKPKPKSISLKERFKQEIKIGSIVVAKHGQFVFVVASKPIFQDSCFTANYVCLATNQAYITSHNRGDFYYTEFEIAESIDVHTFKD